MPWDPESPFYLLDHYYPPPVMSVKEHLDESRDPSISARSHSLYSNVSSDPPTPEAVDDASPRTSPSTAPPATPLIFRSHFISPTTRDDARIELAQSIGFNVQVQAEKRLRRDVPQALGAPLSMNAGTDRQLHQIHVGNALELDLDQSRVTMQYGDNNGELSKVIVDPSYDAYGPMSPAGVALADFFRLKEQHAPPLCFPSDLAADHRPQAAEPAGHQPQSCLLPTSGDTSTAQTKSALLSPPLITDARHPIGEEGEGGPWWTLNDTWASWELPEHDGQRSQQGVPAGDALSPSGIAPSPKLGSNAWIRFSGELVKPIPVRAKVVLLEDPIETTTSVAVTPLSSTPSSTISGKLSPTSAVVAAQRRAWLEYYYPGGDFKQRPHMVQLASLRLPATDELGSSLPYIGQHADAPQHGARNQDRSKGGFALGSPFKYSKEDKADLDSDLHRHAPAFFSSARDTPSISMDDNDNCRPPPPPKSPFALPPEPAVQSSFGLSRAGRQRAQSTVAGTRPPPLALVGTAFQDVPNVSRARANSDTPVPSASAQVLHFPPLKPERLRRALHDARGPAEDLRVVQSLLDEQVLTPTTRTAASPSVPSMLRRPATSPALPRGNGEREQPVYGRRVRANTSTERVTFAAEPVQPRRLSTSHLPARSDSTGSALALNAAARLSPLLKNRLQNRDAVRYARLEDTGDQRDDMTSAARNGVSNRVASHGWQSDRCSLEEWEMSFASPSVDACRRHARPRCDTAGADTDPDCSTDGDARTECSTAPSTPTVPAHLLTSNSSPWAHQSSGIEVLAACPELPPDPVSPVDSFFLMLGPLEPTPTGGTFAFGCSKPLPLPRVESDAVLRLRPSLGDLRQRQGANPFGSDHGRALSDASCGSGSTSTHLSDMPLPFRELKASWEARARQASQHAAHSHSHHSSLGHSSKTDSPRIGISVETESLQSLLGH